MVDSAHPKNPPAQLIRHENRQPNGTYVLTTDDPRSIQAYYQDVGVGLLMLPTRMEWEAMRETCLALGEYWRPLGHVLIPGPRNGRSYPLELCYYTAPNTDHIASMKCANLGLALLENRPVQREIVCGLRWASS